MRALVALLVAAACGGPSPGPAAQPPRADRRAHGPSCTEVAARFGVVERNGERLDPVPSQLDVMRRIVADRCAADQWTAAARTCLTRAHSAPDVERCQDLLTADQVAALTDQMRRDFEPVVAP